MSGTPEKDGSTNRGQQPIQSDLPPRTESTLGVVTINLKECTQNTIEAITGVKFKGPELDGLYAGYTHSALLPADLGRSEYLGKPNYSIHANFTTDGLVKNMYIGSEFCCNRSFISEQLVSDELDSKGVSYPNGYTDIIYYALKTEGETTIKYVTFDGKGGVHNSGDHKVKMGKDLNPTEQAGLEMAEEIAEKGQKAKEEREREEKGPVTKTLGEIDFAEISEIIGEGFGIDNAPKWRHPYATRLLDSYILSLKGANGFVTEMNIVSLDGGVHNGPSLDASFDTKSKFIKYPDGHTDAIASSLEDKPFIYMNQLIYTLVTFDGNGSLSDTNGRKVLNEKSVFNPTEQAAFDMAKEREKEHQARLAQIRAESQSRP
jgi:hypothetical protein